MPIPSTTTQKKPSAKQGQEKPEVPQDTQTAYVSEDAFIQPAAQAFGENLNDNDGREFGGSSLNRDSDYVSGEGYESEYTTGDQLPPLRYRTGTPSNPLTDEIKTIGSSNETKSNRS